MRHYHKKIIHFSIALKIVLIAFTYAVNNIDRPQKKEVDPAKVRDLGHVIDLQVIQRSIIDYYVVNQKLPKSLNLINTDFLRDPQGLSAYRYHRTKKGFNLCATFAHASKPDEYFYLDDSKYLADKSLIRNPGNWNHSAGEFCFERVMNKKE